MPVGNAVTLSQVDGDYDLAYWSSRENMIQALRQGNNLINLVIQRSLVGVASDTMRFPKAPNIAATSVADGTDLTNTAYSPSNVPTTVAEIGVMFTVTDFNLASTFIDMSQYAFDAGGALGEKITTDLAGLAGGFSNTTGTSTADLTEQQFRDAITALRARKVRNRLVGALHDQQENDLIGSIGSTVSAAATTGTSPREVTNDMRATGDGDLGTLFGVMLATNALIPTANAGADRAGGIWDPTRALGYVEKWAIRMEQERDASLRGTEIVGTAAYSVVEVDDTSGQSIITDA